jgi:ATP-dependent Clp protease ATP-binding subunit ClpA
VTPPPTLQELIDTVRRDAGTEDPLGQLAVASATASDLEQTTDALLGHFVDRCRRAGRSWSEISGALGVTKQAVHKRFAGPVAERLTSMTGPPTFERFTPRARNVLAAAAAEADASNHQAIGTGHLLIGLYTEPEGVAAKALANMQISRDQIEAALRTAWAAPAGADDVVPGPALGPDWAKGSAPDPAKATAAARKPTSVASRAALVNAVAVALELQHNYIGTEHILLGFYRDPDCLAARVLAEARAGAAETRVRVTELLRAETRVRVTELLRGYTKP